MVKRQHNLCSNVSSAEVQTLCFVSPLCEDFDFAVIVLELDCAVE